MGKSFAYLKPRRIFKEMFGIHGLRRERVVFKKACSLKHLLIFTNIKRLPKLPINSP
jgi:hypothetical protein